MIRLLFFMPWWAYLIIAPIVLALSVFGFIVDRQQESDKALARLAKPPIAVPIEQFNANVNQGVADEVVITGQVDVADMMAYETTRRGAVTAHWDIAPVYPTAATDKSQPAIAVLVNNGSITDAQMSAMTVGRGVIGPIMTIDGRVTTDWNAQSNAKKALAGRVALPAEPLLIDPFEAGREDGLKPDPSGAAIAAVGVGAAFAIGALGWWKRSRRNPKAQAAAMPADAMRGPNRW